MATTAKARKGDLILVEEVTRNHYSAAAHAEAKAAGRTLAEVEKRYKFGVVASATREGEVKTWRQVGYGEEVTSHYAQPIGYANRWVLSAKAIDVVGALTAAKAHHWPGHPDQPRAFDSFDEARDLARPFLLVAVRP